MAVKRSTGRRSGAPAPSGLLLTHGAGSDRDHRTLLALEHGLDPLPTHRMNFPYRRRPGKRPPDRAPVLIASLVEELESWTTELGIDAEAVVLGGRSLGGRICSMAVADGLAARALILLSYPLHPPGKPERLRTEHFPSITVPCLFVSGDRDPFGKPEELETATRLIAGPVTHHTVTGGRHDVVGADDEIVGVVADWLGALATS